MSELGKHVYAVILAGGSGTRFWPKSRQKSPKQLCAIGDATETMLEITLRRLDGLIPPERRLIVTHVDQIEATRAIAGERCAHFLAEPDARNTANALALAALELEALAANSDQPPVMISLHADHVIQKEQEFHQALKACVQTAELGYLTLMGIVPSYAETGYGYIEQGPPIDKAPGSFKVQSFREKPDLETAEAYVKDQGFFWNAGIFVWQNQTLLSELRDRLPKTMQALEGVLDQYQAAAKGFQTIPFEALTKTYTQVPKISIDNAVLELSSIVACLPADIGWQDVGSWDALAKCFDQDAQGNLFYGDVMAIDTEGTTVDTDDFLVATVGLRNMVVVCAKEAILVCPQERAQEVKKIVAQLKEKGRVEYL